MKPEPIIHNDQSLRRKRRHLLARIKITEWLRESLFGDPHATNRDRKRLTNFSAH